MSTLHLTLKKKWYDMIASGEKKEEYREYKEYWQDRLQRVNGMKLPDNQCKIFDTVTFKNGYQKNAPTMVVECLGIDIGKAKPEWSDNWQGDVFRIKLGKIISKK